MHTQRVTILNADAGAPHPLDERIGFDNPAPVFDQNLEQHILRRRKLAFLTIHDDAAAKGVQRQVLADLDLRASSIAEVGDAAQHPANAHDQLVRSNWLADVIVSILQSLGGQSRFVLPGEDDDRQVG